MAHWPALLVPGAQGDDGRVPDDLPKGFVQFVLRRQR
jgi:hypothetical protein